MDMHVKKGRISALSKQVCCKLCHACPIRPSRSPAAQAEGASVASALGLRTAGRLAAGLAATVLAALADGLAAVFAAAWGAAPFAESF